jgi:phosphatidate cytidylyltransferase
MSKELTKRIISSLFLISLLSLVFFNSYILIISLIVISIIVLIEFYRLISKIFTKNTFKINFLKLSIKALSLIYLTFFSVLIFEGISQVEPNFKFNMIYLFSICIFSDIGGLFFGKIFKGRKLTKISPNKTISGSIGSFILSLILVPFFYYFFEEFNNPFYLIILAIVVSFSCQLGDLFISYLKRKARVKDASDLLPGHGGFLDRIDGILFAMPVGIMTWEFLITAI